MGNWRRATLLSACTAGAAIVAALTEEQRAALEGVLTWPYPGKRWNTQARASDNRDSRTCLVSGLYATPREPKNLLCSQPSPGVSEVLEDEPGGRRPQERTQFPPPSLGLPSVRTYVSSPSSVPVDMAPCSSTDGPESRALCLGRIRDHHCSLSLPSLHQVLLTDEFQSNHGFPCWPHHPFLQLPPEDISQGTLEEDTPLHGDLGRGQHSTHQTSPVPPHELQFI
nr:uncharacterized protein LOC107402568 [Peromyscus maniculatus bairdii]